LISKSFLVSGTFPIRLDKYLIPELPQFSRTRIQALIKEGCNLVDGNQVKPGYQLQGNERIQFQIPEEEEGPERVVAEKIPLDILYEDESLIVINKPPRLTVHPGTGKPSGTLVNGLVYYFNELSDINGALRPGIVHRLDEDTSGILVVAKTNPVHRKLAAQFEQRQVEKTYVGVTWGQWEAQEGSIRQPIKRSRKDPRKYVCDQDGKPAVTDYKILGANRYLSEVEFYPRTGRTHQLRVHCAFVNHPLLADEKYGGGIQRARGFLPEVTRRLKSMIEHLGRHALHAWRIKFHHPATGKPFEIEAPLPEDLLTLKTEMKALDV